MSHSPNGSRLISGASELTHGAPFESFWFCSLVSPLGHQFHREVFEGMLESATG